MVNLGWKQNIFKGTMYLATCVNSGELWNLNVVIWVCDGDGSDRQDAFYWYYIALVFTPWNHLGLFQKSMYGEARQIKFDTLYMTNMGDVIKMYAFCLKNLIPIQILLE